MFFSFQFALDFFMFHVKDSHLKYLDSCSPLLIDGFHICSLQLPTNCSEIYVKFLFSLRKMLNHYKFTLQDAFLHLFQCFMVNICIFLFRLQHQNSIEWNPKKNRIRFHLNVKVEVESDKKQSKILETNRVLFKPGDLSRLYCFRGIIFKFCLIQ